MTGVQTCALPILLKWVAHFLLQGIFLTQETNPGLPHCGQMLYRLRHQGSHKDAKMSTIKDRNGIDLTEAEDIKKRWQEYTEELYKKDFHDQITTVL